MRDLRDAGVGSETVARLVREGAVTRVARGLCQLAEAVPDARRRFCGGLSPGAQRRICLISALQFHELTLQTPSVVWIAGD